MPDNPLDLLPLDVLIAMQEAMADPSEKGRERARLRALDAGFYIECTGLTGPGLKPIALPEGDGSEAHELNFETASAVEGPRCIDRVDLS